MRPFPPDLERAVGRGVRVVKRLLGLVLLTMVALKPQLEAGSSPMIIRDVADFPRLAVLM